MDEVLGSFVTGIRLTLLGYLQQLPKTVEDVAANAVEEFDLQRTHVQLLLDGKIVALMAASRQEKQMWVDGINTVAGVQGDGLLSASGRDYGRGSTGPVPLS